MSVTEPNETLTQQGPDARAWLALAVLTVPIFMVAIDMSVLFLALPSIAADLAPTATQQLWTLHIGDLLSASLVLTAGTLADRIGPRRLLSIGMVAYGSFSLLAAFSPNAVTLILARGLIGIAAVTVAPATMVLLRHTFPTDRQFATAVAVFMAAFSGGAAFGPPIGGVLLEHFSWGAIFLANVPVSILILAAMPLLPAIGTGKRGPIDLLSVGLSLAAIALLVYGLQEMAAAGFAWSYALMIAIAVLIGAVFVRRQLKLSEPMFDMRLFANPGFAAALTMLLLFLMALGACYMQFAQYLQSVLGFSPLDAGMLLTIPAALQVASTVLAPRLLDWMRPATAIAGGAVLALAGAIIVLVGMSLPREVASVVLVLGESVTSVGGGPIFALSAGIIIASAPVNRTGAASGAQEVAGSLGNALGLAVGGSLAVIVYQASLTVGPDAREAIESVGRAVALAQTLPGAEGRALLEAARHAFTDATYTVYLYAIVLYLGFIAVTLGGLRNVRLDNAPAG